MDLENYFRVQAAVDNAPSKSNIIREFMMSSADNVTVIGGGINKTISQGV